MNGRNEYEFDVMISWTGKDRELKNAIREALEAAGLTVYDSERDCVGRFRDYLVPVWNLALLCDCGGVTRWTAAGLALPAPLFWIICAAGAPSLEFYAGRALAALFIFCWVYLWGSVAERLGKSFWLWGAACLVFGGVPVLFLAFDGSMPRR